VVPALADGKSVSLVDGVLARADALDTAGG
jgi:hypothetical protein